MFSLMHAPFDILCCIPAHVFSPAQLVSRISHRDPTVLELLGDILRRIVTHYPQQSLWALLATRPSPN